MSNLAARLRSGTKMMHVAAERGGVMRQILVDRAITQVTYVALLRSLHAIYSALETALARHATHPAVAPVYFPQLARADQIAADLIVHHGPGWESEVGIAPAAEQYVLRLHRIAVATPALLVAHSYVRYMGDLSGGQLLHPLIAAAAHVPAHAGFSFYEFAGIDDVDAFKARYRAALDAIPADLTAMDDLVAEANEAFALHVRLFDELAAAHRG